MSIEREDLNEMQMTITVWSGKTVVCDRAIMGDLIVMALESLELRTRLAAAERERDAARTEGATAERVRWRLTEVAATELLQHIIGKPTTVGAQELIAKCVMPALSACPKCGACFGVNIDCDLCTMVMDAWRAARDRLAADGEGIKLPGDDE